MFFLTFNMYRIFVVVYNVLTVVTFANSARILAVFPTPSISHQVVFRPLTQELARRGHEVVVITTDPAYPKGEAPANLTEIDVHNVSYEFYHKMFTGARTNRYVLGDKSSWLSLIMGIRSFRTIIEVQIKSAEVQNLFREKREFDLLLVEAFMRPAIGFSYIFKAPVIQVSSFGAMTDNLETVGASTHPIFYPMLFRHRVYNLTVWEKLEEYYRYLQLIYYLEANFREEDEMLQRIFGQNIPSVTKLLNNVDMLFLNVNPIWMDNQPMPPNVVFMGGLHQKPIQELPQDLKTYLDLSINGVIYVSFGTNVHPVMFPSERLRVLMETFSELPYDILLKWNNDEVPGKPDNVKISKWLPQADLLRHPKVKVFVTQGGLQSTDEAITAGVPLICIPMLGDQWYNAEKYVKFKIGLQLDFITLTKSQLKEAIKTVIADKSYRSNIVRLRERMNDQPQTPLERSLWWIEYVLRHGEARHLRAPTANVSWAEYYELELVLVVLAIFFTLVLSVLYLVRSLWRSIPSISVQFTVDKVKIKRS